MTHCQGELTTLSVSSDILRTIVQVSSMNYDYVQFVRHLPRINALLIHVSGAENFRLIHKGCHDSDTSNTQ